MKSNSRLPASAKIALFLAALPLLLISACATKRTVEISTIDTSFYDRIAVLPFETESIFSTIGHQLADEIVVRLLHEAPHLDIVERTHIDASLRELALIDGGYVAGADSMPRRKILGVKGLLTGSLSIDLVTLSVASGAVNRVAQGVVTARLIDAETGRVVWAETRRCEAYSGIFYGFDTGDHETRRTFTTETDFTLIQESITELADGICQSFAVSGAPPARSAP